MSLLTVAVTLGACATVPNPLHLLNSQMADETPAKPAAPATAIVPASLTMSVDYMQQVEALGADNLNLKKELADALSENARLKRQLNEAMQDNSLLRDLAARKMR